MIPIAGEETEVQRDLAEDAQGLDLRPKRLCGYSGWGIPFPL